MSLSLVDTDAIALEDKSCTGSFDEDAVALLVVGVSHFGFGGAVDMSTFRSLRACRRSR